jgi:putative membrane protein
LLLMWPWMWGGWGMGSGMLFLWPLLALGGYLAYRGWAGSRRRYVRRRVGALEIARERYARGEITREELEEIRRNL